MNAPANLIVWAVRKGEKLVLSKEKDYPVTMHEQKQVNNLIK